MRLWGGGGRIAAVKYNREIIKTKRGQCLGL